MSALVDQIDLFRSQGIPHRRIEDWKYTDLRSVLDIEGVEHAGDLDVFVSEVPAPVELYLHKPKQFVPDWVGARMEEVAVGSAMDAAARGFSKAGIALRVPHGVHIEKIVELDFRGTGHAPVFVFLEAGSSMTLLERHHPDVLGLQNVSVSIFLEEDARLSHIREAAFSPNQVTTEAIAVLQLRNSRYSAWLLHGGAKPSRTEFDIRLLEEHATVGLFGLSVLSDGAHSDVTTRVAHWAPNTTSRQLFKEVAGGKSRAVYQGKVTVKEGAIGSDSRQTAKALLLSNHAEADLKPELDILADDVKCAHGAAVGDLDQESLFYLRSRGIPEDEARGLLVHAFLQEVIDGIENEEIRNSAVAFVDEGLARAMRSDS